jgi:hypothetical protein
MAVPANSSASAHSPPGIRATTFLLNSGFSRPGRLNSVLIQPGAIAFTRMPSSANEIARDLVNETTALLAALYAGACGAPKYEYIEPMLMRQPLLSFK